ncbi:ABC transporter ATP-binding protein [Luedemannella flava]|uniref:ABC transporter ATP-binding protein n=1 Tax=Luedemannella flava TaxID=349316 RepID=A0ABP4YHZ7_9ACTN
MSAVVEVRGLRKTYRSVRWGTRQALDGFDMTVHAGEVHGFLGPNGSGKSTTLRVLLGLTRAGGGEVRVLGEPVPRASPRIARRVGALVESPRFFPHFSAWDTLALLCDAGRVPRTRVDEVLELVGLRDRARDRVRTYSLGMRQRLAVAMAVLKHPDLLILDEPANGLDPAGIRQMRDLMRALADSGMTVVLASHILGEVQQLCDSVTIISDGRRVGSGSVADVLSRHASTRWRVRLESADELAAAARALAAANMRITALDDQLVVSGVTRAGEITRVLALQSLYVSELTPDPVGLEDVFLLLTDASVAGRHRLAETPTGAVA